MGGRGKIHTKSLPTVHGWIHSGIAILVKCVPQEGPACFWNPGSSGLNLHLFWDWKVWLVPRCAGVVPISPYSAESAQIRLKPTCVNCEDNPETSGFRSDFCSNQIFLSLLSPHWPSTLLDDISKMHIVDGEIPSIHPIMDGWIEGQISKTQSVLCHFSEKTINARLLHHMVQCWEPKITQSRCNPKKKKT